MAPPAHKLENHPSTMLRVDLAKIENVVTSDAI
jgi:hypothetical protein